MISLRSTFFGVLFAAIPSANSGYATECASQLGEDATARAIISCMGELQKELEQAQSDEGVSSVSIPEGAIMAFDRPNGCPRGWSPFDDAGGRVIVGAGPGMIPGTQDRDRKIETKKYREHGGEENHTLSDLEVAGHEHEVVDAADHVLTLDDGTPNRNTILIRSQISYKNGNSAAPIVAQRIGEKSKPHNNMPPYIALYFCKHEGTG